MTQAIYMGKISDDDFNDKIKEILEVDKIRILKIANPEEIKIMIISTEFIKNFYYEDKIDRLHHLINFESFRFDLKRNCLTLFITDEKECQNFIVN